MLFEAGYPTVGGFVIGLALEPDWLAAEQRHPVPAKVMPAMRNRRRAQ
jgi:hypothetical protein